MKRFMSYRRRKDGRRAHLVQLAAEGIREKKAAPGAPAEQRPRKTAVRSEAEAPLFSPSVDFETPRAAPFWHVPKDDEAG